MSEPNESNESNETTSEEQPERDEPITEAHFEQYADRSIVLEVVAPEVDISVSIGGNAMRNLGRALSDPPISDLFAQMANAGFGGAVAPSPMIKQYPGEFVMAADRPVVVFLPTHEVPEERYLEPPGMPDYLMALDILAGEARTAEGAPDDIVCQRAQGVINKALAAKHRPFIAYVFPSEAWISKTPPFAVLRVPFPEGSSNDAGEDPDAGESSCGEAMCSTAGDPVEP